MTRKSLYGIVLCLLVVIGSVAPTLVCAARFTYDKEWGNFHPSCICADSSGNIYATDANDDKVRKFDKNGEFLFYFNATFNNPVGICCDSMGYIYVVDSGNDRICKFDSQGQPIGTPLSTIWTGQTASNTNPYDVYVAETGKIYVTDMSFEPFMGILKVYDVNGNQITTHTGSVGETWGNPKGVYVDSNNHMYVVDYNNQRIQKWNGSTWSTWATASTSAHQYGICADLQGRILYTGYNDGYVYLRNSDGQPIDSYKLTYPIDICCSGPYVYVVETFSNAVKRLIYRDILVNTPSLSIAEGASYPIKVKLAAEPIGTTTVTLAVSGDSNIKPSTTTLEFDSSNWKNGLSVDIKAEHDGDTANGQATITISATDYPSATVSVTEQDNYSVNIVANLAELNVLEGSTAQFAVSLSREPVGNVKVLVSRTGDQDIYADKTDLTFTQDTWNTPQYVTLTANQDDDAEDGITTISLATADNTAMATSVKATETDDDVLRFIVTPNSVTVPEDGEVTVNVKLSAKPAVNVQAQCDYVSGDPDISDTYNDSTFLNFTVANWNDDHQLPLKAKKDVDSQCGVTILRIRPNIAGVEATDFTAVEEDNYSVRFITDSDSTGIVVPENGSVNVQVKLSNPPDSSFTAQLGHAGADPDIRVSPAELSFSASNWNTWQLITLNADPDPDAADGVANIKIEQKPPVSTLYAESRVLDVYEEDDDTQALVFASDVAMIPECDEGSFYVSLFAQPLSDVTVTVTPVAGGDSDLTLKDATPLILTFTPSNWDQQQPITLEAAKDPDAVSGSLQLTVEATGCSPMTITAHEIDNDNVILVNAWGAEGVGNGEFKLPSGICADSNGDIYVADTDNSRIQKFGRDGSFILSWGKAGLGNGEFKQPYGVCYASNYIFVSDTYNSRIQKFDKLGAYVGSWDDVLCPRGLCSDPTGDYIYVADSCEHKVKKFTLNGEPVTEWGTTGTTEALLNCPSGVCTDSAGNVYVADTHNNRIAKFTGDGVFLGWWGACDDVSHIGAGHWHAAGSTHVPVLGSGTGQLDQPWGICKDVWDNIYVADTENSRVQKFDTTRFATDNAFVTAWGTAGSANGELQKPRAIYCDPFGDVYVADTWNHRIQKFGCVSFITSTNQVTVPEDSTVEFTVRLSSEPKLPVNAVVSRLSGDGDIRVTQGAALTFTSTNWHIPQTVKLKADSDDDVENGSAVIRLSDSDSYLPVKDIDANEQDNDTLTYEVIPNPASVPEGGETKLSVRLTAKPTDTMHVWVYKQAGDADIFLPDAVYFPFTPDVVWLTFTPDNWYVPQQVRVAGKEDLDGDDGTATIYVGNNSGNYIYATVNEIDNDALFITDADEVVVPEGGSATFQVKLRHQPCAIIEASVNRVSGDEDIKVDTPATGATLHFDDDNYDTWQTITLSDAEDLDIINGRAVIRISANGIPYKDVNAVEADNDSTRFIGRTYTTKEDFAEGVMVAVQHNDKTPDQLQLPYELVTLPYIWVPNNEGTVSKINVNTGNELGRYRVGPSSFSCTKENSPSRTTVDLFGNCWVGYRGLGTVVKIGLLETGNWIDRNGDGECQTSKDTNGDGNITGDEILPWGQDECVLHEVVLSNTGTEGTYVPAAYTGSYPNSWPRALAIDADSNIWVGTYETNTYYHINGQTGQIMSKVNVGSHKPYGAVIDAQGVLWSSENSKNIVRLDLSKSPVEMKTITLTSAYGIALDYANHLFAAGASSLSRINVLTGEVDWMKSDGSDMAGSGVTCTKDNSVWIANSGSTTVTRYDNSGQTKIAKFEVGSTPKGVAVDSNGKVWACNLGDEYISRIDPVTNTVDLKKKIIGSNGHYTYSDMTGSVVRTITSEMGTWTVEYDNLMDDTAWGTISWTSSEPAGTSINVKVRSSDGTRDEEQNLVWSEWEAAANGVTLSTTPNGRYLQIRAGFKVESGDVSPILYDLTVLPLSPLTYSNKWGGECCGIDDGDMCMPAGICTDSLGNVYVANEGSNLIQKFSPDGSYIRQWGMSDEFFAGPQDVCTDRWDNMYVADTGLGRIQKFGADGSFLIEWQAGPSPRSICADQFDNIYVLDSYEKWVYKYSSDGILINQYGGPTSGDGQLIDPRGICCDTEGNVYVADGTSNYVKKFSPDGAYIARWGNPTMYQNYGDNGVLDFPYDICSDSSNRIYVVDANNSRVQVFSPAGRYLTQWGSNGSGPGSLSYPNAICSSPSGSIYVVEQGMCQVQKFTPFGVVTDVSFVTVPENGTVTFQVKLSAPPATNTDVALTVTGDSDITISAGSSLTFTKDNWDIYQQVTLHAAEDVDVTSGMATITAVFAGALPTSIIANEKDNDAPTVVAVWGQGRLACPMGMWCDASGNIYVVDGCNGFVEKTDANGNLLQIYADQELCIPWGVCTDESGSVYIGDSCTCRIAIYYATGAFSNEWSQQKYGFNWPAGICRDSSGNFYVTDNGSCRITKYNSKGMFIREWGTYGTGNSQFYNPYGICCDSANNVYVVDTGNNRVQKFTCDGAYIAQWGTYGTGNSQFSNPHGICCDSANNIYVTDLDNDRVQKFTSTGVYITQWGGTGSGEGQLDGPEGICVDPQGFIYVADSNNHRIQKFACKGMLIASTNSLSIDEGGNATFSVRLSSAPSAPIHATVSNTGGDIHIAVAPGSEELTFDSSNWDQPHTVTLYAYEDDDVCDMDATISVVAQDASELLSTAVTVTEVDNDSIALFTDTNDIRVYEGTSGSFVVRLTQQPCDDVVVQVQTLGGYDTDLSVQPATITFTPQNWGICQSISVSAAEDADSHNGNTVIRLSVIEGATVPNKDVTAREEDNDAPPFTTAFGQYGFNNGQFVLPRGICTDGSGNIYVADTDNNRIQKFSSSNAYLAQWGTAGAGNGQFIHPWAVCTDSSGNIYVADTDNNRIQKFSSTGTYIATWGNLTSNGGMLNSPRGIRADSYGNVYVADTGNNRVVKYAIDGTFKRDWRNFNNPHDVACDSGGNIYVANTGANSITKIALNGKVLLTWGSYGTGSGQFNWPVGVSCDPTGRVYVADTGNNRVQKFNSNGVFITQWGSSGSTNGLFNWPHRVCSDASCNIFVADTYNNRVQRFNATGQEVPPPAPSFTAIGEVRRRADSSQVDGVVGVVTAVFGDYIYIEDTSRAAGIRVLPKEHIDEVAEGVVISVSGTIMTNDDGERYIDGTVTLLRSGGEVAPLGMSTRAINVGAAGINTGGLLVRVSGTVAEADDSAQPRWFKINDGSGVGIKVTAPAGVSIPLRNSYVAVTAICASQKAGSDLLPLLQIRRQNDVQLIQK